MTAMKKKSVTGKGEVPEDAADKRRPSSGAGTGSFET